MLKQDQTQKNQQKDESVEELMAKLAKKGKKVKLLDESASVKELPKQEDDGDDVNERDENDMDNIEIESPTKTVSSVKKKMSNIKQSRE